MKQVHARPWHKQEDLGGHLWASAGGRHWASMSIKLKPLQSSGEFHEVALHCVALLLESHLLARRAVRGGRPKQEPLQEQPCLAPSLCEVARACTRIVRVAKSPLHGCSLSIASFSSFRP